MSLTESEKARNENAIATLLPEVQALAKKHLELCAGRYIDLIIVQALRTKEEQDALYAQGRTVPGRFVTNAQYGHSWHCFGMAYDIAIIENGAISWTSPKYEVAGSLGKSIGLVWGGEFKAIKGDKGHFEYHPGLTLAQARENAGLTA